MNERQGMDERRQSQQKYDGDDRRKMQHQYEQPMGDEPVRKPAMNDGEDRPN